MAGRRLPCDACRNVLSCVCGGPWALPCRLVCRAWSRWIPSPVDDAAVDPSRPWETVLHSASESLLDWVTKERVPWSSRVLEAVARRADLDALRWAAERLLGGGESDDRREINTAAVGANLVRAGRPALSRLHGDPALRALLAIASVAVPDAGWLEAAVRFHGTAGGDDGEFSVVWDLTRALCGPDHRADTGPVCMAARCGSLLTFQRVAVDYALMPAFDEQSGTLWRACLGASAGRRRGPNAVAVFRWLLDAGPPGESLPWSALCCAVETGKIDYVRAFLAHPCCPRDTASADAADCALAVVTRPRPTRPSMVLLETLSVHRRRSLRVGDPL